MTVALHRHGYLRSPEPYKLPLQIYQTQILRVTMALYTLYTGPMDTIDQPYRMKDGAGDRPSKCPNIYTKRILGEQNLRQKMFKFSQNFNRNKMPYLIKYTLTVQFSI